MLRRGAHARGAIVAPVRSGLGLFVLLLLTFLVSPASAAAQAPGDALKQETAGPLRITVRVKPREPYQGRGGPRFSVEVADAATGAPIDDAQVVVAMDRPDGTSAGEIELARNLALSGAYESRISLPQAGLWEWHAAVTTSAGTQIVEGTINVRPPPSSGARGTIAWFALLVALGGIALLAWRSLRPKRGNPPRAA